MVCRNNAPDLTTGGRAVSAASPLTAVAHRVHLGTGQRLSTDQCSARTDAANRTVFLELAARGLRVPIAADLALHEEREPDEVRENGPALARVIARAARRWNAPIAFSLMDLRLEKTDLLALAGIPAIVAEGHQFTAPLDELMLAKLCAKTATETCPRSRARDEALTCLAAQPDLIPVGMAIGPFSLATRLLTDPITAVAMAGAGIQPQESDEVRLLWQCLLAAEAAVERSVRSQIMHGAKAVEICEPAACTAFISPRQLKSGSDVFERLVIEPNLRLKNVLAESGCNLVFHDCGELIDAMVEAFAQRLHPAMLSLGSSRKLWEDARLVPEDVVLYGNLPSRTFYSDAAMPVDEVARRTREVIAHMRACGHPYIVGTECDVLFVREAQFPIRNKLHAMMTCSESVDSSGGTRNAQPCA